MDQFLDIEQTSPLTSANEIEVPPYNYETHNTLDLMFGISASTGTEQLITSTVEGYSVVAGFYELAEQKSMDPFADMDDKDSSLTTPEYWYDYIITLGLADAEVVYGEVPHPIDVLAIAQYVLTENSQLFDLNYDDTAAVLEQIKRLILQKNSEKFVIPID